MEKLIVSPNAYYSEQYKNNGYLITSLPFAYLVWGKDGEVIRAVGTIGEAEEFSNSLPPA